MKKKINISKISNSSLITSEKCSETVHYLTKKINILTRENQSLSFMMEFKDSALKNREEIIGNLTQKIKNILEENKELKEKLNKLMSCSRSPLKLMKQSTIFLNENKSANKLKDISPTRFIPSFKINRSTSTEIRLRSSTTHQRKNESHHIRKITQFSGVETVTESQGLPKFHTLMNSREGRRSILNPEEMKQLDQTGLKQLETWIFSTEGLQIGLDLKEQIDLQENLKSFFCDFKRVIKNGASLKKAITSIFSITSSLDLEQIIKRISSETCELLSCDKTSFFFLEELGNDDVIARKNNDGVPRIQIPKGIASFVLNTGKILKIDNAKSDPRFNTNVETISHVKVKSILCAPVKDVDGKILGILQAINKNGGAFLQEDSGIIDLLSMVAGISLKNALMYDSVLLNEKKLFRLMEIISALSQETDIKAFVIKSREYLSHLILSKQTQVFLYDRHRNSLVTFEDNESGAPLIISDIFGLLGFVLQHKKIYETFDPREDLNYNPVLDLNTDLPILTVPILDEDKTVLGIFQFTNIRNQKDKNGGKSKWANYDLINLYATFLANSFRNILQKGEKELSELVLK